MPELTLHGQQVQTVFDLLGKKERDITFSVGWALAQSPEFSRRLLADIFKSEPGEVTAVRMEETVPGEGRTDIEVETESEHLIIEAKRGWDLPTETQLVQYAPRLADMDSAVTVVVSECTPEHALSLLPTEVAGAPVAYRAWKDIAQLADESAANCRGNQQRLLRELLAYLRGLMTMQNVTSNMVYVVSLGQDPLGNSSMTFKDIVVDHGHYFHPVGGSGSGGWPRTPPTYLGFRFDGRLQRIHHVESYERSDEPWAALPQLRTEVDWTPEAHFSYTLGPVIEPSKEVRTGKLYRAARVWAALDLLLTSDTIAEARDLTNLRLQDAGLA